MKAHSVTTLARGAHPLPCQSQITRRDLQGEQIARSPGAVCHGFMLTDDDVARRVRGEPGTGLPYRYIVSAPNHPSLAFTAFFTREAFEHWLQAYGCKLSHEPSQGEPFLVQLPAGPETFEPLRDTGTPYDESAPDPDHAALYRSARGAQEGSGS